MIQPPSDPGAGTGARRRQLVATVAAVTMHGALLLWAARSERPAPSPPETRVRVAIVQPPARPTPPRPATAVSPEAPRPLPARLPAPRRSPEPPRDQAEAVEVEDASPGAPVDLTAGTILSATSVSTSGGRAPGTGAATAGGGGEPGARVRGDRSGAVSLESQRWSCPWPRQAEAEQIDEQTVVIRVVVDRDGRAESVEIVSDPGHGFGEAAAACALRTRFTPARDGAGDAARATSPPIRVQFTRTPP